MKLIPATRAMLDYTRLLTHEEARDFVALWGGGQYAVLDDGDPFGIIAITTHPGQARFCWGNVWIAPSRRGNWMEDGLELVKAFGLMRHEGILAGTADPRCQRFLRMRGFNKYCQEGDVSYYSLIREVA